MGVSFSGEHYEKATFAGGCFWCMEPPFEQFDGVVSVEAGYTGGQTPNPSYEEVCSGKTGHREVVQLTYDPGKVSYEELLEVFWRNIDPTDAGGQFADRGPQYETAVFYHNETQKAAAERSKQKLEESGKYESPIVTRIEKAGEFYPAEEYHQDYYKKSPFRYKMYKKGSGREGYLERTWSSHE
ncbi:MAG: peptide-methionine (S)-S-oxide reductase MsrA [Chitinivibrionales bacterium]|nr:peptide-methionine (S)-S-oxide reductase MsrA [Chitinivibrionales bacterium]